jgi:hypothetical protein
MAVVACPGKYVQAIDCYSWSIALQPTAVAFAN